MGRDLKHFDLKLHRTKCGAIIKNVSPSILKELIEDIGDSYFSLIVDESTDVGCQKYLCICIKYFSKVNVKIETCFLSLVSVTYTTADALFSAIEDLLVELNLPINKIIGLGTDGANNLCGQNNSVYTKLKKHAPNVMLIRCVCHSLHLCLSEASTIFNNEADFIIRETYNWFKNSPLRRSKYAEIYKLLNGESSTNLKFFQIAATRWLSRSSAVERICSQYLELQTFFQISAGKEKCHTANLLFMAYKKKRNYLILLFLRPILKQVSAVNMYFQKEKVDFFLPYVELRNLIINLLRKIIKENVILSLDLDSWAVGDILKLLIETHNLKNLNDLNFNRDFDRDADDCSTDVNITDLLKDCQEFLITLVKALLTRLPSSLDMFKNAFILSPTKCLNHIRTPSSQLPLHYLSPEEASQAVQEYENLITFQWKNVFKSDIPVDSETFWQTVYNIKNAVGEQMFGVISKLAFILLALPHSNAFVERIFSTMNLTKTKLRNRMQLKTLTAIIRIKSYMQIKQCCCKSVVITEDMLNRFNASIYNFKTNEAEGNNIEENDFEQFCEAIVF